MLRRSTRAVSITTVGSVLLLHAPSVATKGRTTIVASRSADARPPEFLAFVWFILPVEVSECAIGIIAGRVQRAPRAARARSYNRTAPGSAPDAPSPAPP